VVQSRRYIQSPKQKLYLYRTSINHYLNHYYTYQTTEQTGRMRQKRAKTYKRVMALYTQTFGFRTPFQILGTFDDKLGGAEARELVKTQCHGPSRTERPLKSLEGGIEILR